MSSDGYFDGEDDFNESFLAQVDAIEAAHFSPAKQTIRQPALPAQAPKRPPLPLKEDSFDDISFEVDEAELARIDTFVDDSYKGKAQPVAGPSKFTRTSSGNMLQTTLFGDVLKRDAPSTTTAKPKAQIQRTASTSRNPFGQQARKTKQWDQTAFSKTGVKSAKPKDKGKGREYDEGSEEETVEFEQFPAPFVSNLLPPPMKLVPDLLEAKHWIFPINRPKRDYQFNIVRHCLFDNTLVALPTGLGKTFIAGVVMLNYYRWFPEGKVVFVAPTKPLVAQQVTACHETCGIPGSDSIEMTGEVPKSKRAEYWAEKRVFFMTPQTLVNDLVKETCNSQDIVLLVVDEAHRATGNYAYNQAIRYLMAKNPHFRVLALTATPGNNTDTVQKLIDGLHISRIEIRNEESLDLKAYIHKKTFIPHDIKANPAVVKIRDLLVNVMNPLMKPMYQAGVLRPNESPLSIHPYRPQALMRELQDKRFFWSLSVLSKLARAMLYLLTGSIEACFQFLVDISTEQETEEGGDLNKKKSKGKKIKDDPNFRILMQELERQRAIGFDLHPKMEELLNILVQYFGNQEEGADETRVMVFSSYRAVVDRIVEELNKHQPLLRPTRFIGQAADKQGNKGFSQKEQQEVLTKFKAGVFNILVATCIGEEGLDIGEIDMTVCYDADKAPTRMIQRFGRTGRKRAGTIHALLAEERENLNIEKAEATYREVQKMISKGEIYELYGDVERLIPEHMKPECIEKVVEIQEYVREKNSPRKKGTTALGTKRKRNDDVARNIPEGASRGFVSVKDLIAKASAKSRKKVKLAKDFDVCGEDDETDEDIESGRVMLPRRTQSAAAGPSTSAAVKPKTKAKLRKSSTIAGDKAPKPRRKKNLEHPTASQFSKQGLDDSDDMDIEKGAIALRQQKRPIPGPSKSPTEDSDMDDEYDLQLLPAKKSPLKKTHSRAIFSPVSDSELPAHSAKVDHSILELTDSERGGPSQSLRQPSSSPVRFSPEKRAVDGDQDMSWLVDDDDDDNLAIDIVDSSPLTSKHHAAPTKTRNSDNLSDTGHDDSVVEIVDHRPAPSKWKGKAKQHQSRSSSPEVLALKNANIPQSLDSPIRKRAATPKTVSSPFRNRSSSPLYPTKDSEAMPPPVLPHRFQPQITSSVQDIPEPSYPIRPLGNQAKRRRVLIEEPESPLFDEPPPPSQRRLHRMASTPPSRPEKKQKKPHRAKPSLLGKNVNIVFDGEAAHSGDEVSEGASNSEDDVESESDRAFIKDSPITQANMSYEQTQMYRRSLMTQFDDNGDDGRAGPAFARGPARARPFGRIDGPAHAYGLPSSSPPPPDDELDAYEMGSFVVGDEEEIVFD